MNDPPKNHTANVIWRARYDDGTELLERDAQGKQNRFADIDQSKLQFFDILSIPRSADDFASEEVFFPAKNLKGDNIKVTITTYNREIKPIISVSITPDKRLIFARRQTKSSGTNSAIFGDDPNAYPSNKDIPRCPKCNKFTTITHIPYPMQFPSNTIIIIGWQQTIGDKNVQAINYLFPDGTVELAGEWGSDATHKKVTPYIPKKDVK